AARRRWARGRRIRAGPRGPEASDRRQSATRGAPRSGRGPVLGGGGSERLRRAVRESPALPRPDRRRRSGPQIAIAPASPVAPGGGTDPRAGLAAEPLCRESGHGDDTRPLTQRHDLAIVGLCLAACSRPRRSTPYAPTASTWRTRWWATGRSTWSSASASSP